MRDLAAKIGTWRSINSSVFDARCFPDVIFWCYDKGTVPLFG